MFIEICNLHQQIIMPIHGHKTECAMKLVQSERESYQNGKGGGGEAVNKVSCTN